MSLVVFDSVGLDFADRVLFDGVGLRIAEGDRIGLIGPNGSGKTTLLRLIAGQQSPDRGSVSISRGVRIGYLAQDFEVEGGSTLGEMVLGGVPGRRELDDMLAAAEAAFAELDAETDAEEMTAAGMRIAEIHERIQHFDSHYSEHEALRILRGLGFTPGDEDREISEFSGGWRMRGVLASILFQRPDLMLLDEPTNHLDLPSVAWFGGFLRATRQAYVLISHDREFLNEHIARVVSLEPEGLRQYNGNYEQYAKQRAEESQILEAQARNLARERERLEKFVERFRYKASKATSVQSRVKALKKMDEVETFESRKVMRFRFPPAEKAPGEPMRVERLTKAYGDHVVLRDLDLVVRRGEKVAMIGANGAGKTTLLRVVAGELDATAGEVRIGNGVKVGYYAQHHADALHRDSTLYQEVSRANPEALPAQVRSALGAFLFSGDDVDKKISVLSGGERARVALAKLLIRPANLLLMDEPTNHLDLESSESLAEALAGYDGTLVFVSHNRAFIRRLATRIWNVEDQKVETYPGTLDEYLYSCRMRAEETSADAVPDGSKAAAASAPEPAAGGSGDDSAPKKKLSREAERERKRREAEQRQLRSKRIGPLEKRVARLETKITKLEKEQAARSEQLSDPELYDDATRRNQVLGEYQKGAEQLEDLTEEWEAAVEELTAAEAELESD